MSRAPDFFGLDRRGGKSIAGLGHLQQSVEDILTTRKGTRVERREYGSRLPDYIDHPMNDHLASLVYAEAATNLMVWEPRLRLSRVRFLQSSHGVQGRQALEIRGEVNGEDINLKAFL